VDEGASTAAGWAIRIEGAEVKILKRIYRASVFRSMKGYPMPDVFAAWFHRKAAILYLVYVGWAILQLTIEGAPSLVEQQGDQWTSIFAIFVILTTGPACLGATFFPRLAHIELYAGFLFAVLICVYLFFLVLNVVKGEGSIAGTELIASILVMPVGRTAIISYFLVKQAEADREKEPGND
jgi:hypothetical protein